MKRRFYLLIPLLVLLGLIGWRLVEKRAENVGRQEQRAARMKASPSVVVSPVEVRDIVHTFEVTGTVEAPLNVKIAAKVTGRIDALPFREGDKIKKGQVLVRIDPSEVEANVQQQMASLAEAQYRLAQAELNQSPADVSVNAQIRQQKAAVASATADFNQTRENYDSQVAAAEADVQDSESRLENAKAGVTGAQANLDNVTTRYNRILGLYKEGFTAAQEVDDAKTAVSAQQATLDIAKGQVKSAAASLEATGRQASIVKTKGKADIEAARAKMVQAQASLDYANANAVQKPAYEKSLAALRSSVEAAGASLRSAQARRADTVITSPLDGFVTGRYADPGAVATPGQPILAVEFMKQVWVTVSVPESVVPKLHIGQPAKITLDALSDRPLIASVIQINPSADEQSRQYMVRVILSNPDNLLKPGMFARVSLETDRVKSAIVVPREAVQNDKIGDCVMVVDSGGKANRRSVVMGLDDAAYVAIKIGVQPGEKVITMSAFPVRDGQAVSTGGGRGQRRH